ncbi:sensor histidine kinase [Pseudodesulfovibrio senegalensis]|uniref:histidine kinase n=1 Tax=Pseudodesulfovibrio senegalensis TaxID=1721087 RepID=A0A6N6N395_9BACT|nr:sensor histidine kinase [Pseudodesulfovibrio senegalensis]KAB1441526.1 HAMP domain-containing protein [Pseudodesulfovibrio senegalensis]
MFRPNLRHTIIIGIAIFTLAFGGIALLSLSNINQLEQEVTLVERADDLRNLILEIRREEKNFFLYHDKGVLSLNRHNIQKAATLLQTLSEEIDTPPGREHGRALKQGLARYNVLLGELDASPSAVMENAPKAQALREAGQSMVEHSIAIAEFERQSVLTINHKLRTTLVIAMGVVAIVVLALVIFVSKSILGPLRRVHEATRSIAQGTFEPLAVKNAEDEIQQVFVALNSMVEELNKRQTQLVQAQKLSSIGTLASGIAHQLNNPLNNISTSAQLLSEQTAGQNPFADKMMDNIAQETVRARDIVKGLLEFSRHKDFSPRPCNIKKVITSALQLVSSQIGPRITVNVRVADEVTLYLDRQRFNEALINLIINATQAIGDEEGTIEIESYRDADHKIITIADSGPGIPPEILQRIFDPFFSTKEVGQGTGLGLYVVYGIIEEHNGSIRVESAPGQGTKFFIRLPLNPEKTA